MARPEELENTSEERLEIRLPLRVKRAFESFAVQKGLSLSGFVRAAGINYIRFYTEIWQMIEQQNTNKNFNDPVQRYIEQVSNMESKALTDDEVALYEQQKKDLDRFRQQR